MLALATLVGVANGARLFADPAGLVIATPFSAGHVLAAELARAKFPDLAPWTPLLGWPHGAGFRPLNWPVNALALLVGAVPAVNLGFVLAPSFNAACGFALARALGRPPWSAVALGLLLAWNPWVHNTLANGQLEQAVIGGAALMWATGVRAARGGGALLPAVATAAVGLGAPHVGLIGAAGLGALALADARRWRAWAPAAVGVVVALLAVHAWHSPSFGDGVQVFAPKGSVPGDVPPDLPTLFETATAARLLLPPAGGTAVVHCAYLGWVALLVSAPRWTALAALFALVATGLLPTEVSALVAKSANPYRWVLGAVVALAAGASFRVAGPRTAALVVALAWIETGLVRTRGVPLPVTALPTHAGGPVTGPVLDLPLNRPGCGDAAFHYALEAARHRRAIPMVTRFTWGAYAGLEARARALDRLFARPDCAERLPGELAALGVAGLVVHEELACPGAAAERACVEAALGEGAAADGVRWWAIDP